MKFEVPDNTFTVYLNETIEDNKQYQNRNYNKISYLYASDYDYWNPLPVIPQDNTNEGDSSNTESNGNLGFSKKEINTSKNNRKVWIELLNNNFRLKSGLEFTLEGSIDSNNFEWIYIDTVKTNQNGILEFNNISNLFTKFRLVSLNNYKFIENENSDKYNEYIICKDLINNDNNFIKLSCDVFLDLEWETFEFFKGYNTYLLKSDDANKLNINDNKENYFTFDSLSQIQSITGLWDIYPYGLYSEQSTNIKSQKLKNSIKLIKDNCEVTLKNTGYYKNNQLQDQDNVSAGIITGGTG